MSITNRISNAYILIHSDSLEDTGNMPSELSPIFLSPRGRTVTVFGGGPVALRKCLHFKGFRIRVVAEKVLPDLEEVADEVVLARIDPETAGGYMDGSDIVVAATSDHSLNDSIRDISMSSGIMTNSAHGGGDVLIPSTVRRDGWAFCVSSLGNAPAFPPYVASAIDGMLDSSYDLMLRLLSDIRPAVMEGIADQPSRARFLADVLHDEDVWSLLRSGDLPSAEDVCIERIGRP